MDSTAIAILILKKHKGDPKTWMDILDRLQPDMRKNVLFWLRNQDLLNEYSLGVPNGFKIPFEKTNSA